MLNFSQIQDRFTLWDWSYLWRQDLSNKLLVVFKGPIENSQAELKQNFSSLESL